jgi:hypothetical protein
MPATALTVIPRNIPDAEPVLFEYTLDANQQESTPPQGVPTNNKISDDHYKWFTSVHNCWMGHRGVRATLDLLQQRNYIWNTMNSDVPKLILQCPTCQKLNVRKLDYQTHPFTTATYRPHEQINVDTLVLNQPDKLGNIVVRHDQKSALDKKQVG